MRSMFSLKALPAKGVYTLIVFLSSDTELNIGKLGARKFSRGYYAYTGPALGIGASSLKNRVSRHLLKDKRKRKFWHIDYFLSHENATVISILVAQTEKRRECAINRYIEKICKAKILVCGFGASNCAKNCKSHFLYLGKVDPEIDFCLKCRRPLNLRAQLEIEEKERELLKLITPEMIEQMIQRKVEEILAKYMPQTQAEPQRIKVMV